jgi:hypothetical protein
MIQLVTTKRWSVCIYIADELDYSAQTLEGVNQVSLVASPFLASAYF